MALRHIHAFGHVFDMEVTRIGTQISLTVQSGRKIVMSKTVESGAMVEVIMP